MASIRIFQQGVAKDEETLEPGGAVIGRGDDVELRLDEMRLSKRHARIFPDGASWIVEDLHSRNGTFVNGRREVRRPLKDGDSIELGSFVLVFRQPAGETVPPLPELPDLKAELTPAVRRPGGGDAYLRRPGSTEEVGVKTMARMHQEQRLLLLPRLARVGPGEPRFIPLSRTRLVLGSGDKCDVRLSELSQPEVATITRLEDGTFELQKVGWISRVKVNGSTVQRHVLDVGDVVELGKAVQLTFEIPVE